LHDASRLKLAAKLAGGTQHENTGGQMTIPVQDNLIFQHKFWQMYLYGVKNNLRVNPLTIK
jgi:hypothetical protein